MVILAGALAESEEGDGDEDELGIDGDERCGVEECSAWPDEEQADSRVRTPRAAAAPATPSREPFTRFLLGWVRGLR
jgi:hypothetical protein